MDATARKIEVEIIGDSRSLEKALGRAGKSGSAFGKAIKGGALLAGGALLGLGIFAKKGFGEFIEAEQVMAQTRAGLKSTGGAANVTAKDITNLASSISKMTGIDDEAVQASENMLLTFTKVRNEVGKGNDVFDKATLAISDMATRMNNGAIPSMEQLSTSSIRIGKALNDPVKGVTALTKAGVQFTEQQKKQIAAMVKSGNVIGAQKLILKELETQFGGSAKAAGQTLGGQLAKLRNRFDEFAGGIVSRVVPALEGFISKVEKADGIKAKLRVVWSGIQEAGRTITQQIGKAVAMVDWTAVWSAATGIAVGLQRRFEAIDWTVVGTAVGNGIADAMAKAMAATQKFADAFLNAARSIDWVKLGKAMGPGLAAAIATAFVTLMDPAFWAKNWDLALAVGLSLFGGRIVKFAGGLVMKAVAPLTRAGGDMILAVAKGIESFAPRVASAFLAALVGLSGVATRALSSLAGVVRTQFEKLSGLAQFAVKVLGIQAAINVIADFAGKVRDQVGRLIEWLAGTRERFGRVGRDMVSALVGAVVAAGPALVAAARGLGASLVNGIVDGIKGNAGRIAGALTGAVGDAFGSVKSVFGISSPSRVAAEQIGKPLAEGIVVGILSGKQKVTDALVNVANAAVDRARSVVEGRGGEIGSWLQRAFDAKQGSKMTKTELLISKKELEREKARLAEAISGAQADLQAAMVGGDPAAVAAAQRALDDAQYAQWLFDAQRQATAERTALENRQWIEQQNFQKRLGNLQTYLSSGHATAAGAKARILDLMHDFGIQAGNMAQLLGKQFAAGLRKMIPAVAAAAEALRIAVKNEGILLRGRKITIELEEKAEKKKGSEVGATHIAGLDSISTKLHDEITIGRGMGLSLSSGYRPGDDGDHGKYPSHAIDMSGSGSAMAQFATSLFGRAGTKDVINGNLNVWQDNGRLVSGWAGNAGLRLDHLDHVHASVFDKGGLLMPGATLAINNTGVPERVVGPGGGGSEYHFHFPNYVGTRDELVRAVKSGVQDMERNGGSLSRPAPGF